MDLLAGDVYMYVQCPGLAQLRETECYEFQSHLMQLIHQRQLIC